MQTALVHERAGHDLIIDEMAGQKPVVRMNVLLAADHAEPVSAALRLQPGDSVDQPQPFAARERERWREGKLGKRLAKAAAEVAVAQRVELALGVRFLPDRDQLFPRSKCRKVKARYMGTPDDALTARQFLGGKEAGAAVGHGEQRLAIDCPLEVEAKQVCVALAEEAVDLDVVAPPRRAPAGRGE